MTQFKVVLLFAYSITLGLVLCSPLKKKQNEKPTDLTQNSFRVVNGVPVTDKNEYPFVVDLSAHPIAISSSRFCTGTLISKRCVLTAAHCVLNDGYTNPVFATVGRIELHDDHQENKKAQTFRTIASIVHPDYKGLGSGNDVALLLLNGSSSSRTVKLAGESPNEEDEAWVVGYGVEKIGTLEETGQPIEVLSGRLQKTALRIKNKSFCDIPQADILTADGMLCTAGVKEGSSACKGDSGGGLFLHKNVKDSAKDGHKRECVQIGVVSYGDSKCMSEDSGVFTSVSSVIDWIDESAKRLEQVFHPARIQMDDISGRFVVRNISYGTKKSKSKVLLQRKGKVRDTELFGDNVKLYQVETNFTKPKNLTISLCGGPSNSRAGLHVVNNKNGAVLRDNGSCPGGKLSKLSFAAERGSTYVVGVAADGKVPITMTMSTD